MLEPEPVTTTRPVGVCSHCAGAVLLTVTHVGLAVERDASCGCGATRVRSGFFSTLARLVGAGRR